MDLRLATAARLITASVRRSQESEVGRQKATTEEKQNSRIKKFRPEAAALVRAFEIAASIT
jgi:hypothetical protein